MNRLPIMAAALLCLPSFSLFAQPITLQMYGVIDTGIAYDKHPHHNPHYALISGGQTDSLWGIQGQHSLAHGLTTLFKLESKFNSSTGEAEDSAALFQSSAILGLTHEQLGQLYLGRQNPVSQQFQAEIELAGWKDYGIGALLRNSDNVQKNNSIQYISPAWSNMQLGLGYQGQSSRPSSTDSEQLQLAWRYQTKQWYFSASIDQQLQSLSPLQPNKTKAWQLGAKWNGDFMQVAVAWAIQKNGFINANGGDPDLAANLASTLQGMGPLEFIQGGKINSYYVGLSVPIGAGTWTAQWSQAHPNWHWHHTNEKAQRIRVYSLGYSHQLSKRTELYTFGAYGKRYDLNNMVSVDGQNQRRIAIGLSHSF